MASQLGLPLVPDTSYYYPRFYLGLSEGEKRESGEIPSCDMCFDGRYYAVSGFITGAIGAKFPGMNHLVEGVVDTTVSAGERLAYAVFDDSMSWDEKWAYAFDPGQMVADFVTGVVIGEILDGIMAAIQNKLRSIFANYDAAMREAFESGTEADLFLPDEFYNKNLPNQVAPGTKYLPKYDELGNVKHIKMYDDCGREIGWGDYTNHGYGAINSPHYQCVVEDVWENAKGPAGLVRDPNICDIINWTPGQSRKGVWDMGHIPEAKYSEMHEAYMNGELTTKEFVDWYNDPANYRPELPSNNRSHKYE